MLHSLISRSHDIAIWAKSFGATVTENITRRTTHVIASPQRRTAKVRQAAKKPDRISIVTQDWLYDSLSQWQRVNEDSYRIHAEVAENGEKPTTASGSPFDGPDDNTALSSSDEEAALTEEEGDIPNGASLTDSEAQEQAELEQYMPSLPREDSSPNEETNEDWDNMNDELADFLGSDAEDDSEASDVESTRSTGSTNTDTSPPSVKKRKRDEWATSTADGEESDASQGDSKLQRRKRKALVRTTSLVSVATSANIPVSDPTPGQAMAEVGEDDDDAALAAELEAEMLRQAEEDEDDT